MEQNDIGQARLDTLNYYIFSSKDIESPRYRDVFNNSFRLWREVWTEEFEKLNFSTDLLIDDFIRQDYIVALANENEAAAVHLYSIFSLDSDAAMSHRYIRENFPPLFFESLEKRKVKRMMSWEYLTVSPNWRKAKTGVSLGKVILNLAGNMLLHSPAECAIAPARNDYKVSEMVYQVGGEPIISNVVNHNVSCDLLACFKDRFHDHSDPNVSGLAQKYWKSRVVVNPKLMPAERQQRVGL